ncbi:MAG: energy-coupling factor ABC transporter ATP-binding protein [Actinomycetales bacterium]
MPRIELDGAAVRVYAQDGRERTILAPTTVVLDTPRIAVIGANGSGKSTFLRLLNGLLEPSSGTVRVNGLDTVRQGRSVRRQVGFVFTDPLAQLVMPTPLEDVELSLRRTVPAGRERRAQALTVLADFGLAHLAQSSIYELSGGERQLAALATVLSVNPRILVLDEPSTLLDLRNTALLRRILAALPQQLIVATHDLDLALDCSRALVVEAGEVVFDGTSEAAVDHYRRLCS